MPVVDVHVHIYPDKIALKAAKGIGSFYDIGMHYDGRLDTLKAVSARSHVVHSVIFSVATTPHSVHSINTFIAQNVRDGGGRFQHRGHGDADCDPARGGDLLYQFPDRGDYRQDGLRPVQRAACRHYR